jgi:transposase-like protein
MSKRKTFSREFKLEAIRALDSGAKLPTLDTQLIEYSAMN